MPGANDLDVLQRWMLSVISHPGGVEAGVESAGAQREIPLPRAQISEVIPASKRNDSYQRLAVYGNAYFARLIECLAAEFPALRHAAGEEAFAGLASGYLQATPSQSYTLAELGRGFPGYLQTTRPPRSVSETPDWPDFLIDLSTLERIYSEVFDGPGHERVPLLTADSLRAIPGEDWPALRLQTTPSLRLATFRFPVHEYATAVRLQQMPEFPPAIETRLAIHRRDYVVRRRTLTEVQFALLQALDRRQPLADAIEMAAQATSDQFSPVDLQTWFQEWTAAGYFIGVSSAVQS
ncbi:hypothetical protein SAMN05421753_104289 [Planctomicrobium piriforme]|uniref:Putative DNA-binding domain-containing protein n=2 Tax=Planctomicrobium piriforme TaxID=1576369 RepID=A0A1I3EME1_9PLAN|nr:hypothetical protein SAMN05421753_104289 [Planctomicrobium piriforme]